MKKIYILTLCFIYTSNLVAQVKTISVVMNQDKTIKISHKETNSKGVDSEDTSEHDLKFIKDEDFSGGGKLIFDNKASTSVTISFYQKYRDDGRKVLLNKEIAKNDKLTFVISDGRQLLLSPELSVDIHTVGFEIVNLNQDNNFFLPVKTVKNKTKETSSELQSTLFNNLDEVKIYLATKYEIKRNKFENVVIENGIIHIFLDENCQPIFTNYPTTARDGDKFQFHIFSRPNYIYAYVATGVFIPTKIENDLEQKNDNENNFKREEFEEKLIEHTSQIFGPYTTSFRIRMSRKDGDDGPNEALMDNTINLLKTSRVSVNTGVVTSFIKNPENISKFTKPNGDTTLIADYTNKQVFLTIMLTFHFRPRNLDIKARNPYERLGFTLGTNISSSTVANNYFFGLNYEITNGLFLNAGAHLGQVQYVVNDNDENFNFGQDKFTGTLVTKNKWQFAPYICVSVDAALFAKVFRNLVPASNN